MLPIPEDLARELAIRFAGAHHNRRLYGHAGRGWSQTLEGLRTTLSAVLQAAEQEVTVALLGEGLAVQGRPVVQPPSSVTRLVGQLKARDVEIVCFVPGVDVADLEVLFGFLAAPAAQVAGVHGQAWLTERGVERIRIKHLRLVAGQGVESFRDVYFRGRRVLGQQFHRVAEGHKLSMAPVTELARSLMEMVVPARTPVATLLALRDRSDFTLVHSVNVATLVGAQAAALGLDDEVIQSLVSAGLTHDLGKTRVPEGILNKRRLSAAERTLLQAHTVEGARLLLEAGSDGGLAAVVAQYHHTPASSEQPGLLPVELCRIADVFDGLRSLVSFDDEEGVRGAVSFMWRRLGDRFNPYLLQRFARLLGVGQAGEEGRLQTGEWVRVLEAHPELAFLPRIEVLRSPKGGLKVGAQIDLCERASSPLFVPELPAQYAALSSEDIDALG